MHEYSFIEAILSNIENKEKVIEVVIEVGELAGIEPDHLREHLLERVNWKVEVISRKGEVFCECGYKGSPRIRQRLHDLVIYDCPKCGNVPRVIEGKNIKILKVVYI